MMHAVLQEIAKRHPNSIVYINSENTDLSMIIGKYPMTIKKRQSNFFRKSFLYCKEYYFSAKG